MDTQSILVGSYATIAGAASTFGAADGGACLVQLGGDNATVSLRLGGPDLGHNLVAIGTDLASIYWPRDSGTLGLISRISGGTTAVSAGDIVFSNSNSVTFGLATNSAGGTVTASAVGAGVGIAVPGQTGQGTVVLSQSNGISFGMAGSTITASADVVAFSAAGGLISTGTASLSPAGGVAFGIAGQTVTAAPPRVSLFDNGAQLMPITQLAYSLSSGVSLQRIQLPRMNATRADVVFYFDDIAGSRAGNYQLGAALYTMAGSTAQTVATATMSLSWATGTGGSTADASEYDGQSGLRWRTIPLTWNVTPGDYLLALALRVTHTVTNSIAVSMFGNQYPNENFNDSIAIRSIGTASPAYWANGQFLGTIESASAMPASINLSQVDQTVSFANMQPFFRLAGT